MNYKSPSTLHRVRASSMRQVQHSNQQIRVQGMNYKSPSTLQRVRSTYEQHIKQIKTSTGSTGLCVSLVQKLRKGKITFSHPELTKLQYLDW